MKVGIIGAGVMGRMLADNFARAHHEILISDIDNNNLLLAGKHKRVTGTVNNTEVVDFGEVVFNAVKPQHFDSVIQDLTVNPWKEKMLISVLAGIPIKKYTKLLGEAKIVRIMPNLPISIGKGVVGVSCGQAINDEDKLEVIGLLNTLGTVIEVHEKQLDVVTALAGSGPAYIFVLIEALADAGVKLGLPYQQSLEMVLATVEGSASLLKKSGKHPAELKALVSSPSGTTVEGLYALEKGAVRSALIEAVESAYNRARELSK